MNNIYYGSFVNNAIECAAIHCALLRGCNPFITFTGVTSYIGPIMEFVLYNNLSLFLVTIILNIFELSAAKLKNVNTRTNRNRVIYSLQCYNENTLRYIPNYSSNVIRGDISIK